MYIISHEVNQVKFTFNTHTHTEMNVYTYILFQSQSCLLFQLKEFSVRGTWIRVKQLKEQRETEETERERERRKKKVDSLIIAQSGLDIN